MLLPAEERRQEHTAGGERQKGKERWVRLPLTAEIQALISLKDDFEILLENALLLVPVSALITYLLPSLQLGR